MSIKEQINDDIIELAEQATDREDLLTLQACMWAIERPLPEKGLIQISKCVERVRERIEGVELLIEDWFDN